MKRGRHKVENEFTALRDMYKISPTYFMKLKEDAKDDIEELKRLLEAKAARDKAKEERKNNPPVPKKRVAPIVTKNNYPNKYNITIPDYVMSRDEFYIFMWKQIQKSVFVLRGKFYTLKQNNISSEDLIHDILVKCMTKAKSTKKEVYDLYLEDPVGKMRTIRVYTNRICTNHFIDHLKGPKYTTPVTSLDIPLADSDNLTLGDSIGVEDIDLTAIDELVQKCNETIVRKETTRNGEYRREVRLSEVLDGLMSDIPLTRVCQDLQISARVAQRKFLEIGILDILGLDISQEHKNKILGNN